MSKAVAKDGAVTRACAYGTVAKAVTEATKYVGDWSASDLSLGLRVLRKAEHEDKEAADDRALHKMKHIKDKKLLDELLLWGRYVKGSYKSDDAELLKAADIVWSDVLEMSRKATPLKPAFWVAKNDKEKSVVLTVRGTDGVADALTDMAATSLEFGKGRAHQGMVNASGWFVENYKEKLLGFLADTGYKHLVLLGHSLGAGTAALLSMRLNDDKAFKNVKVHAFAYAPPAAVSEKLAGTSKGGKHITSVVLGDDLVPRASLSSFEGLRRRLEELNWQRAIVQQAIPDKVTKGAAKIGGFLKTAAKAVAAQGGGTAAGQQAKAAGSQANAAWDKTLSKIGRSKEQRDERHAEKEERLDGLEDMFAPGRVLYLARDTDAAGTDDEDLANIKVLECKAKELAHIGLSDTMVSDHGLASYMTALKSARVALGK